MQKLDHTYSLIQPPIHCNYLQKYFLELNFTLVLCNSVWHLFGSRQNWPSLDLCHRHRVCLLFSCIPSEHDLILLSSSLSRNRLSSKNTKILLEMLLIHPYSQSTLHSIK